LVLEPPEEMAAWVLNQRVVVEEFHVEPAARTRLSST
jgi:hypothetical protein